MSLDKKKKNLKLSGRALGKFYIHLCKKIICALDDDELKCLKDSCMAVKTRDAVAFADICVLLYPSLNLEFLLVAYLMTTSGLLRVNTFDWSQSQLILLNPVHPKYGPANFLLISLLPQAHERPSCLPISLSHLLLVSLSSWWRGSCVAQVCLVAPETSHSFTNISFCSTTSYYVLCSVHIYCSSVCPRRGNLLQLFFWCFVNLSHYIFCRRSLYLFSSRI